MQLRHICCKLSSAEKKAHCPALLLATQLQHVTHLMDWAGAEEPKHSLEEGQGNHMLWVLPEPSHL